LSESDWKQYAIADNTASDFSTWDVDLLNDLAQEVDLSEFFPDYKLNELLESFGKGEGFGLSDHNPESSTQEIDSDNFEFDCKCPKCGFEFNK
jgi:hypothetical protein